MLVLPDTADPDEFIKAHGVEAYHKQRGAALPHIQFVLEQATRNRDLHRPADKDEAVKEVLPFISSVRSTISRREYFDMSMDVLRVDSEIRRKLWQSATAGAGKHGVEAQQKVDQAVAERQEPTVAERRLLELLVHDRDLQDIVLPQIESSDCKDLPTEAIFDALKKLNKDKAKIDLESLCAETASDPVAENLVPLLFMSEPQRAEGEATDEVMAEAQNCLSTLRSLTANRRWKELDVEINAAQRTGKDEQLNKLVMERMELERLMERWESERRKLPVRVHVNEALSNEH